MGGWVGWLEEWGLKLTSAKVVVQVEANVTLNISMKKKNYQYQVASTTSTTGKVSSGETLIFAESSVPLSSKIWPHTTGDNSQFVN